MGDYLRIARVYLRGPAAAVWLFMFVCLLSASLDDGEMARNQGGIVAGVLSRKSYMAMFAYFNACVLGVLLRDNIAHPWASLLPHYRKKHLLVTMLIALLFLGIPMFSMMFVGTNDIAPTSVAVIFLTCLAAGLWTLQHTGMGVLAFPFLAFVTAPSSSYPELAAFLAGTNPAASAALAFISLLALWAFTWRLLVLNEDMLEHQCARVWGDLLRGRGMQTFTGLFNAKTIENRDSLKSPFTNLKQVDNLFGYSERSLWQRLQLWRLGTAPSRAYASVGGQILISLIAVSLFVFIPPLLGVKNVGVENPATGPAVIMSVMIMTNPFNIWLFWFMRRHRLGYESLRPRSRQEFVRELGLALLWDITQCWLGGVLFMGIAAAIWAPELLQVKNIFLFVLGTGVGQLCVYAMMGIWLLTLLNRGLVASLCAFCPFLAMAIWIGWTMNSHIGVELNIAIALVLAAASVATIALAYRRWCRADLA